TRFVQTYSYLGNLEDLGKLKTRNLLILRWVWGFKSPSPHHTLNWLTFLSLTSTRRIHCFKREKRTAVSHKRPLCQRGNTRLSHHSAHRHHENSRHPNRIRILPVSPVRFGNGCPIKADTGCPIPRQALQTIREF